MAQDLIPTTVTGQQLIEAVEAIAKSPVVNRDYVDGKDVFVLGQSSEAPYEDLIITADGSRNIEVGRTYHEIAVLEHEWPGMKWAVGYGQDSVIKAVKEFSRKLREQIGASNEDLPEPTIAARHIVDLIENGKVNQLLSEAKALL